MAGAAELTRRRLAALALLSVCVAACGSNPQPSSTVSPTSSPDTSLGPSAGTSPGIIPPPATQLKPVLGGLLDRGGAPPSLFLHTLDGYVVNAKWRDLQTSAGAQIAADNPIDQAIDQVRSLNAANGTSLGLKLRLYAGIDAPEWAKNLGGSPVPVTDPLSGQGGTVGRFWSSTFEQAYSDLQAKLAAKYDNVPEVREVTISSCMTVYAEPFMRDATNVATVQALLSAGYSVAADHQCQQDEINAHAVWRKTHSDLSFNPYQVINPDGSHSGDEGFTESMMSYCRNVLGSACVLENNSLRSTESGVMLQMYERMKSFGPPICIQTAVSKRVGDLQSALDFAVSIGANSVELPAGYQADGPQAFAAVASRLAVNAA
jgi:hypothetical protein